MFVDKCVFSSSVGPPEGVGGEEASTELEGLVQRAGHLLAGLLVGAHVLHAGEQLGEPLAEQHLAAGALGRRGAHAVRPHPAPRAARQQKHLLCSESLPSARRIL